MKIIVNGETPFKALKQEFMVGATTGGYTLAYSADKENWTADSDAVVPADETLCYLSSVPYGFYKLSGNTDTNTVVIL
jgi:hypothetical protein